MLTMPSFKKSLIVKQFQGNYLKVAGNSPVLSKTFFQSILMGNYTHSIAVDAKIIVSKHCPLVGEQVLVNFVAQ